MKTTIIILIVVLTSSFKGLTQGIEETDSTYFSKLFWGESDTRCNLIFFGFNYLSTPKTTAFAAKGTHFFVGLNLSRFFNDKIVFGPFLETKQSMGGAKQHLSSKFISAFNSAYTPIDEPETAHLESETFYGAVNGLDGYGCQGNQFWNVGIAFSPFPDRYGGFMIKLSKGTQSVSMHGPFDEQIYVNDDGYYMDLFLNRRYAVEVAFHPFNFKHPKHVTMLEMESVSDALRMLTCSFYVEELQMVEGTFRTTPLTSFIKPSFLSNHPKMVNFGFKIGFGLK